jgi:hypothetical protein
MPCNRLHPVQTRALQGGHQLPKLLSSTAPSNGAGLLNPPEVCNAVRNLTWCMLTASSSSKSTMHVGTQEWLTRDTVGKTWRRLPPLLSGIVPKLLVR